MQTPPTWILEKAGLSFKTLEPIVHKDTLSSEVYKIELTDGSTCILKLAYNTTRYRKEKHYLNLLHGIIPVPRVLHTVDPEVGFHGALVLEYIPGELLKAETLTDDLSFQMGEMLAQLHSVPVESYGDLSLPAAQRKKTGPLELMRAYFEESVSECKHRLDPKLLHQCREYVHEHLSILIHAEGPHIVHRDFRCGNILARAGKVQALIDFEISKGSFAQEDFVRMETLAWANHPHSRPAFLKGYASIHPLPKALDEMLPVLCLLSALGAIGFTCERGTFDSIHAHVYNNNLIYLEKFFANKLKK